VLKNFVYRLLKKILAARRDLDDLNGWNALLDLSPTLQGFSQGNGIDIFEIAAHGQSAGDAGNGNTQGFDDLGQIQSGRFPIHGRVGRHDNFPDAAAPNPIQ
jgi:hypothetical protein